MTRVKYAMALLGLVGVFTGTPARGQSYPVYWDVGEDSYRWARNLIDFATETWVLLQGFVSTADPDWNADDWDAAFGWGDHLGLYLPILGTARSALKLVSENGMSWIEVSHGTGTFYTVSVTSTDTNTIVLLESDGYNGGTPPWVFDWSTEGGSVVWSNPGGRVSWDVELGRWMHYSLAPGDPWIWHSQTNNALDSLPIILFPAKGVLGNRATGTMKIDYLRTYVTNSIEFVAFADDYYDKATTDFRIAAAVGEIDFATETWVLLQEYVTAETVTNIVDEAIGDYPALTNLTAGAGISITGTGRVRDIESTITQYEDTDAVSAIKADADWNAAEWDTAFGWGDHPVMLASNTVFQAYHWGEDGDATWAGWDVAGSAGTTIDAGRLLMDDGASVTNTTLVDLGIASWQIESDVENPRIEWSTNLVYWSQLQNPVRRPCYLRLVFAASPDPMPTFTYVETLGIDSYESLAPIGSFPLRGIDVEVDDRPSSSLAVVPRMYVDRAFSTSLSTAQQALEWWEQPAGGTVRMEGNSILMGSGWAIQEVEGIGVISYADLWTTNNTLVVAADGVVGIEVEPGQSGLQITRFEHLAGVGTVGISTNGVLSKPYLQWTASMTRPLWQALSPDSETWPSSSDGEYEIVATLPEGSTGFIRAIQSTGEGEIRLGLKTIVDGDVSASSFTLGGDTIVAWPLSSRQSLWYITNTGRLRMKSQPVDYADHWEINPATWAVMQMTTNETSSVWWQVSATGSLQTRY